MTDKQIIIDGVDVSGCLYFCNGYCNDHNDGFKCNLNSEHCYYKQLKRAENQIVDLNKMVEAKEQECEELKEQLTILDDEDVVVEITVEQFEEYKKLKAENEKLKEEKQGLIKDWEEKKNLAYEIACKNEKLKQTLTEIKELCQKHIKAEKIVMANDILQKISEVIDED